MLLMEDNLIELRHKLKNKYGDITWMTCSCDQKSPSSPMPIAMHDAKGPFICCLVCPKCEATIEVEYGRPTHAAV